MNIYEYLEDNVNEKNIQNFNGDLYELALVRYILIKLANLFYRDIIFFLNDEQIEQRFTIYNKEINPNSVDSFNITCYSYCKLIKKILDKKYGIQAELIFTDNDVFRHVALIVVTKSKNRYFIDPLMDLSNMKAGMKTKNFATKEQSNNQYVRNKPKNLKYLKDELLYKIDIQIGYINSNKKYLDDLLVEIKMKLDEEEVIEFFFEKIKKEINGLVDTIIYVKSALNILTDKYNVWDFFVDEEDIKENNMKEILQNNKNKRKRGIVVELKNACIIFSNNNKSIKISKKDWEKIIIKNNIYVRKNEFIKNYKYLNQLELEPNILEHREFQRIFKIIEENITENMENCQNYIHVINREKLVINYKEVIEFSIEENILVIKNITKKIKIKIIYLDEGRNVLYKLEYS